MEERFISLGQLAGEVLGLLAAGAHGLLDMAALVRRAPSSPLACSPAAISSTSCFQGAEVKRVILDGLILVTFSISLARP